ncbi:MAG: rhodanese-like domain-containing protein [Flavobacteriaceae bacterium]|nr:rhodanese-like domain-containing protein [Flavobacteriaceae bacterium]
MKIIRLVLIIFITAVTLTACKKDDKKSIPGTSEEVVKEEILDISTLEMAALENDVQLVDVRTPEEYAQGYIKNAMNVNISDPEFLANTVLLDKSKPVYVYCRVGHRSVDALKVLKAAGFIEIYNYSGGFEEWVNKGNVISMD